MIDPEAPPHLFSPPTDQAHDIYSLSAHLKSFNYDLYQDIQQDQGVFDSLQRWPYLFGIAMPDQI